DNIKYKEIIIDYELTEVEAKIYENMKKVLNAVNKRYKELRNDGNNDMAKRFSTYILAMINYLRQCIVVPMLPIASVSLDIVPLEEQTSELSQIFMNSINKLGIDEYINDATSNYSSRLRKVVELFTKHSNEKIVVFSCYRTIIDTLFCVHRDFAGGGRNLITIDSKDSITKRQEILNEFEESENDILLLTYKIGNVGINLQHAHIA